MLAFYWLIHSCLGQTSYPTSADCTWRYIDQPLSHFEKRNAAFFRQRLCVFADYWKPEQSLPVFLYTGNESPVEEYVNNTGLIWNLAKQMNALIIFAEHRYFGESIPDITGMPNCIAYLTSEEAIADYAVLTDKVRSDWGAKGSAVIAFGGSYGGMLSSWLRIKYPGIVDGGLNRENSNVSSDLMHHKSSVDDVIYYSNSSLSTCTGISPRRVST